ncbi:unnamed protein product [Rhizophagus irregularis]|nr:unnamed protein product [Rhizophagus irregularis]CAB5393214.1 unnamed protein product [Rhizophagus irregularis]
MLNNIISKWVVCINDYYILNRDGNRIFEVPNIDKKLKNDMLEFVKADKALTQAEANLTQEKIHSQAYSTSFTNSIKHETYIQEESQEIIHI